MDSALIRTENLGRTYTLGGRKIHALQNVDLSIPAGRVVAMRGRSGSGKTTLLNCIGGLDAPTAGRVWLDGTELTRFGEAERVVMRRHNVGFVFQSHALLPTYSAAENVDLMLRLAGRHGRAERRARTAEVLVQVGLKEWMDHRPFEMSGGQQQRVAIARALAAQPKIILADEPTGELDAESASQILSLFRRVAREKGSTIIIVTHDLLVDSFVDDVYYLRDGELAEDL